MKQNFREALLDEARKAYNLGVYEQVGYSHDGDLYAVLVWGFVVLLVVNPNDPEDIVKMVVDGQVNVGVVSDLDDGYNPLFLSILTERLTKYHDLACWKEIMYGRVRNMCAGSKATVRAWGHDFTLSPGENGVVEVYEGGSKVDRSWTQ